MANNSQSLTKLKENWLAFVAILFDPLFLIAAALTVFFAVQAVRHTDKTLVASYSILTSIAAGVCGSIVTTRWLAFSDRRVLNVRGRLAVLILKVLLNNIAATEKKIRSYLKQFTDKKTPSSDTVKAWLDETGEKLMFLSEQAVSSIETWSDVVGEANIRTEIGRLTELAASVACDEGNEPVDRGVCPHTKPSGVYRRQLSLAR